MPLIAPTIIPGQSFQVDRLDILAWNLANLFNRQQLIVDIGMLIRSNCDALQHLALIVPFAIRDEREWVDTSDSLRSLSPQGSPETGSGDVAVRPVLTIELPDGTTLTEESVLEGDIRVPIISHKLGSTLESHRYGRLLRRRDRWSLVRLDLNGSLARGETAYVRPRFYVYGPSSMVIWKRSFLAINGAVFDIKNYGYPSVQLPELASLLKDSEAEVLQTNISCVLRATLVVHGGYPSPSQRLLEQGSFGDYLGRATDLRNEGALVSYSVSSREGGRRGPVGRAGLFINASREFGLWSWGNYLRVLVVVFIVLLIANRTGIIASGRHGGWLGDVFDNIWSLITVFLLAGIAGLIRGILKFRARFRILMQVSARIERSFFAMLQRLYHK